MAPPKLIPEALVADTTAYIANLKQVLDVTSRVDERVKILIENQQETNARLERFIDEHNRLSGRVAVLEKDSGGKLKDLEQSMEDVRLLLHRTEMLERLVAQQPKEQDALKTEVVLFRAKLEKLEARSETMTVSVQRAGGLLVQTVWVIVTCYLLYKMGLNAPPLPG